MQLLMLSMLFGGGRGFGGNTLATLMINPQMWFMGRLFRRRVSPMHAIIGKQSPQLGMLMMLMQGNRRRRTRKRYYRRRRRW